MNWTDNLRRWTIRGIYGAILGAGVLGHVHVASAQPTIVNSSAPKNYAKTQSFNLPIRMDPDFRASLTEVRLYVKAPGGAWRLQEAGSPLLGEFQCRVQGDGEYWYTLQTVDRAGKASFTDINTEPPSQRVIVDTQAPAIQVHTSNTPEGDLCLRCTIVDANADPASLKAVCKTGAGELPLEMLPNQPGTFRVRPEMLKHPILVMGMDMAKNVGTKEVSLRDLIGTTASVNSSPKSATDVNVLSGLSPEKGPAPAPLQTLDAPPRLDQAPRVNNNTPAPAPTPIVPMDISNQITPMPTPIEPKTITQLPSPAELQNKVASPAPVASENTQRPAGATQLLNTINASIEYRLDQIGSSGVGKVEIYMTPDNGQSWHRLGDDADKRSPAEVRLPGDGVYGIRICVTNGNGFGGKAPIRGDAPQCTLEVDTTTPFLQLRSAELLHSAGQVELRWNATDKNLGSEPVTLSYRTGATGPWQVIARNLKNDGLYRWTFPRDAAGGQLFFKVEVTDQAGNVAQDISRQPVVIDVSEPRATVVGVSGSGRQN